jgi:hypothetical protein
MRKFFQIGGFVSAVILIAFGIGAIVMGVNGRSTVHDSLKQEYIVGSPDMTPALIKAEAKEAGLDVATLSLPTVSVAGKAIDNGTKARAFASYMRIHALEASGGLTYSQMGRFAAKPGTPARFTDGHGATSDEKYALVDPKTQRSVDNGARNLWVTETALSTALNASYMAESLSLFGVVVGFALLLSGIGFAILAVGGTLKGVEPAFRAFGKRTPTDVGAPVVPAA